MNSGIVGTVSICEGSFFGLVPICYCRKCLVVVHFCSLFGLVPIYVNVIAYLFIVFFESKEVRAAFVSFKSRFSAATAFHMQQSNDPTHWVTELAPEPLDVYWPFFSTTFMERWLSKLMVLLTCIVLTVLFLIPVLFVQGLTNLDQLELWFPFLTSIASV